MSLQTAQIRVVARREVVERARSRPFQVVFVFLFLAVIAAVVLPKELAAKPVRQSIGVVGPISPLVRSTFDRPSQGSDVVRLPSQSAARTALGDGSVALVLIDNRSLLSKQPLSPTTDPSGYELAVEISQLVRIQAFSRQYGLPLPVVTALASGGPLPLATVNPDRGAGHPSYSDLFGLVAVGISYTLLAQFAFWVTSGIIEERSGRVAEMVTSAVAPRRYLAGKVLGIGLLGLVEALSLVAVAVVAGAAVNSPVASPASLAIIGRVLIWFLLGYGFYCTLYAVAGTLVTRQEEVQSIQFPLSLPLIVAFFLSVKTLVAASTPGTLEKVLAYIPLTAPVTMPVLALAGQVGLVGQVVAGLISLFTTVVVARVAGGIFEQGLLRAGQRLRLRELVGRRAVS